MDNLNPHLREFQQRDAQILAQRIQANANNPNIQVLVPNANDPRGYHLVPIFQDGFEHFNAADHMNIHENPNANLDNWSFSDFTDRFEFWPVTAFCALALGLATHSTFIASCLNILCACITVPLTLAAALSLIVILNFLFSVGFENLYDIISRKLQGQEASWDSLITAAENHLTSPYMREQIQQVFDVQVQLGNEGALDINGYIDAVHEIASELRNELENTGADDSLDPIISYIQDSIDFFLPLLPEDMQNDIKEETVGGNAFRFYTKVAILKNILFTPSKNIPIHSLATLKSKYQNLSNEDKKLFVEYFLLPGLAEEFELPANLEEEKPDLKALIVLAQASEFKLSTGHNVFSQTSSAAMGKLFPSADLEENTGPEDTYVTTDLNQYLDEHRLDSQYIRKAIGDWIAVNPIKAQKISEEPTDLNNLIQLMNIALAAYLKDDRNEIAFLDEGQNKLFEDIANWYSALNQNAKIAFITALHKKEVPPEGSIEREQYVKVRKLSMRLLNNNKTAQAILQVATNEYFKD